VLAGEHVYQVFIFDSGASSASILFCFDSKTGAQAWEYPIEFVANEPVVDSAGTIYVTSFDGKAHALAPNGKVQWLAKPSDTNIFEPVLAGDALLFAETGGRGKTTFCLEKATGAVRWKFESGSHAYSLATVDGRVVHAVTPAGGKPARLLCLSLEGGELLWSRESPEYVFKPQVVGQRVHVGSRDSLRTYESTTGVELARLPLPGVNLSSKLLAHSGDLLFGDESGMLRAVHFDGEHLVQRWQHQGAGDCSAQPVVVGNDIAFHSKTGTVTLLDAATGSERAHLTFNSDEVALGGLAFGDGRLFAAHERELRCYLPG
jgi:outer membrane protein assembly factor BamB